MKTDGMALFHPVVELYLIPNKAEIRVDHWLMVKEIVCYAYDTVNMLTIIFIVVELNIQMFVIC